MHRCLSTPDRRAPVPSPQPGSVPGGLRTIICVSSSIGPRWLAWVLLGYGLLEIPWVIYLVFFQDRSGTADHTHLASLGMSLGAVGLALVTAWAGWRGRPWLAVPAVMTATWLAATVFFAVVLSAVHIIWAGLVGAVVAALVASNALRRQRVAAWQPMVLVLIAIVLVANLGYTLARTQTSFDADHLRILVVLYDSAEVAALLGLGLSLRRGTARAAVVFGSAGIVLFTIDAFVNIVVVPGGQAFVAAVFYAIVGEVPSIAMCTAGTVLALRRWRSSFTHVSVPQQVPPGVA